MGPVETSLVNSYDDIRRKFYPPSQATKLESPPKSIDHNIKISGDDDQLRITVVALSARVKVLENQLAALLSPTDPDVGKSISVETIVLMVCKHENIRRNLLSGTRRQFELCMARHLVCYLAANFTDRSLPQIARKLGGRDHTTILHGLNKLTAMRPIDPALDAKLKFYEDLIWARIRS